MIQIVTAISPKNRAKLGPKIKLFQKFREVLTCFPECSTNANEGLGQKSCPVWLNFTTIWRGPNYKGTQNTGIFPWFGGLYSRAEALASNESEGVFAQRHDVPGRGDEGQ